jgi:hypothetical protein
MLCASAIRGSLNDIVLPAVGADQDTTTSLALNVLAARHLRWCWIIPVLTMLALVACNPVEPPADNKRPSRSASDSPDRGLDDLPSADAPTASGRARRIVAVGDIACEAAPCSPQLATARLVRDLDPRAVLVLGDTQYQEGKFPQYLRSYEPSWGTFKDRTYPVPGDHEYITKDARGYFRYFRKRAHPPGGYYSFDLAGWHIVGLNSERAIGRQTEWLRTDLARDRHLCELAFWHDPRWSSAGGGNNTEFSPWWDVLYQAGVDVVLNGDHHQYERFTKLTPSGFAASDGIREFVVGTGGAPLDDISQTADLGSERRFSVYGVLTMHLRPDRYGWRFFDIRGIARDSGTDRCHF